MRRHALFLWVLALGGCTVPATVRLDPDASGSDVASSEAAADAQAGGDAQDVTDTLRADAPIDSVIADATDSGTAPDSAPGPDAQGGDVLSSDVQNDDVVRTDVVLCTSAASCSDGTFCNGAEQCSPGAPGADARGCLAGAPACVAATQDCDEALDTCLPLGCLLMPDRDGDGHNAAACGGDDCDDSDFNRFPGNPEVCDSTHDEDCNTATYGSQDGDGDGVVSIYCCNSNSPEAPNCGTDCDDTRAFRHPGAAEQCNGFDDNCNGDIDEGFTRMTYYYDADGDLYGNPLVSELACAAPLSYYLQGGDCNDTEETIYPGHGCP